MKAEGRFIDEGGLPREGEIAFWGEWEAQSRAIREWDAQPGLPRYLFEPYYEVPSTYDGLQNTDPFVFGDSFFYTGCQQFTNRGRSATFLRWMDLGSLVLFGSCVGRSRFTLDTALVVHRYVDHSWMDYQEKLERVVPPEYVDVTLAPWYHGPNKPEQSYRLYAGANFEHQTQGMYSFFPCVPAAGSGMRFPKPTIELPGLVTPHLTQGKKGTLLEPESIRAVWGEVTQQIFDQDLVLGVFAALPAKANQP
jgi:hypothetical protein